jgi:hypothetical protein
VRAPQNAKGARSADAPILGPSIFNPPPRLIFSLNPQHVARPQRVQLRDHQQRGLDGALAVRRGRALDFYVIVRECDDKAASLYEPEHYCALSLTKPRAIQSSTRQQIHTMSGGLIEDGKVLEANVHVEDPGAFTMPWNAIQRFRPYEAAARQLPIESVAQLASAAEGPLTELICADRPNSFFPGTSALPIPQAVAPDF